MNKSKGKKVVIIGAGLAGLISAAYLAKEGFEVEVIEKNKHVGGRINIIKKDGYTFDIGPSWYMMPKIFDDIFEELGFDREDFFKLNRLDPSYKVIFEDGKKITLPAGKEQVEKVFSEEESGAGTKLREYLKDAEYKYDTALDNFLLTDYSSLTDLLNPKLIIEGPKLGIFKSFDSKLRKYFKSEYLIKILEFMTLFLGGSPYNTPSMYSLINWADIGLGIWYPNGGFSALPKSLKKVGKKLGVEYTLGKEVVGVEVKSDNNGVGKSLSGVKLADGEVVKADIVLNAGDLPYFETEILPSEFSPRTARNWDKKVLAPSTLLFFLGIDEKIPELEHHTLLLTTNWDRSFKDIYKDQVWPETDNLNYYISVASKTDDNIAPEGHENLVILLPAAVGLEDSPEIREHYFSKIITDLEKRLGREIKSHIKTKISFAHDDYSEMYNAYKGNGFGLAHTLWQSAMFRPKIKNNRLENLYYTGQFTLPGTGTPIVALSGKLVAETIIKDFE